MKITIDNARTLMMGDIIYSRRDRDPNVKGPMKWMVLKDRFQRNKRTGQFKIPVKNAAGEVGYVTQRNGSRWDTDEKAAATALARRIKRAKRS